MTATVEFTLPAELEAAGPPEARGLPRDGVRMLVSRAACGTVEHHRFTDLPRLLLPGDLLVVNTSRTLPAAVPAGPGLVVHFSTGLPDGSWLVEPRVPAGKSSIPNGTAAPPEVIALPGGASLTMLGRATARLWRARLSVAVVPYLLRYGGPIRYSYAARPWPLEAYQTVFGRHQGSAEMPSAARPFSPDVVTDLAARGVTIAPVTLHCGVSSLEADEDPYPEQYDVPPATARLIGLTRRSGGRVIAVGTTVVRAVETAASRLSGVRGSSPAGQQSPQAGWTSLVVTGETGLRAVDGLLTGLHEPRSSHLRLLAAFHEPALLAACYDAAVSHGYLWHEFGDVHLMLPLCGSSGELADVARIPRALPAAEGEQAVHEQSGETPDQHRADAERGAGAAAWVPQHDPVARVGQVGYRDPLDGGDLADIHRPHRAGLSPPGQHRDDAELAPADEQLRQRAEHIHAAGVEAGLLRRLAERGGHRPVVGVLDRPAGEGGLPCMPPQPLAALDEQQVGAIGSVTEQHEHGGSPAP
jgi:S-adenosylmethionine:tRNA-ribosyltransferase-isomerase (queuine synthetase)